MYILFMVGEQFNSCLLRIEDEKRRGR